MEVQEIIDILKVAKAEVEWNYPIDYYIAFDEAIRELEYRLPKQPNVIDHTNHTEYLCPSCGSSFIVGLTGLRYDICRDCGQKIEWR